MDNNPKTEMLDTDLANQLVRTFKLLSDETRLRILHGLIQQGELNVRTLCDYLGQSQPAVSHHLALLRRAKMIDCRRDGKHNFYYVLPQQLASLSGLVDSILPSGAIQNRPAAPLASPADDTTSSTCD